MKKKERKRNLYKKNEKKEIKLKKGMELSI